MKNIVIVINSEDNILLVQKVLSNFNVSCHQCPDGLAAKAYLEKNRQDLHCVIVDWDLPGIPGIELLKWIKKQKELINIPVIMMTLNDDLKFMVEGMAAGAYYFLIKPIDTELLQTIVKAALLDYDERCTLMKKINESENLFQYLLNGCFRIKNFDDANCIAARIAHTCPNPGKALAISELLYNAIEHGNLAISYEEKTRLLEAGHYKRELNRRLKQPPYNNMFVDVFVEKSAETMTVMIKDQGKGFNFAKYLTPDQDRIFDSHGRGILMAKNSIDLSYRDGGRTAVAVIEHHTNDIFSDSGEN